jgi:hypothetical protein
MRRYQLHSPADNPNALAQHAKNIAHVFLQPVSQPTTR